MTSLCMRTSAFAFEFPKKTFYVPNPCILGTRPVIPCKNGSCCKRGCKLELVETKSAFVLCYLLAVGCSQVELSHQYVWQLLCLPLWRNPYFTDISLLYLFLLGYRHSLFTVVLLVTARAFMPSSLIVIPYTILEVFRHLHWHQDTPPHTTDLRPLGRTVYGLSAPGTDVSSSLPPPCDIWTVYGHVPPKT